MVLFLPARLVPALAIALVLLTLPVYGQITTPCSPSMISSFTPCMNFITNSSANGTSPTADCCGALKALTSSGMSCLCLIVTAGVPFRIPINRTLALNLPRACNMPGVPVQCKATGAPIPAPGPAALGPTLSPSASPSPSPLASVVPGPTTSADAPESDNAPLLPTPTPTDGSETPTTTGSRTDLTPSAAVSNKFSPSILLFALSFAFFKYY